MGQASDLVVTVGEVHCGWYFEVAKFGLVGVESASVVFERVEMDPGCDAEVSVWVLRAR